MAWNADSKSAARQVVQTTGRDCWFGRTALIMTECWQRPTCWLVVMMNVSWSGHKNFDPETLTLTLTAEMKTKEFGGL